MKTFYISIVTLFFWIGGFSQCLPSNQCYYYFELQDSFGDGWNGNSVTITQNGNAVATLTLDLGTSNADHAIVPVALCDGEPFELFWNTGGNFPNEVIVSILNPLGQVIYTKPASTGSQGSSLFSSTVLCVPSICGIPYNLTQNSFGPGTAGLSWTEPNTALSWQVLVLPAGSPAPDGTTHGTLLDENYYYAQGLIAGNSYDFYVSSICTPATNSDWSAPLTFTFPCLEAENIQVYGAGTSTSSITWSNLGTATAWEIIVLPTSSPPPTASSVGTITTSSPYTVTDLDPLVDYVVYIRSVCSATISGEWVPRLFSTLAVADYLDNALTIFPNPAIGQFRMSNRNSNEPYDALEIYSLQGSLVKIIHRPAANADIDVNDLSKGVYIVKVLSGKNTFIKKLIIQ